MPPRALLIESGIIKSAVNHPELSTVMLLAVLPEIPMGGDW
jgi:hypothetical protein